MKPQYNMINASQEVKHLSEELYKESNLEGKKAGKNNLPAKQELQNPPFVNKIQARCEKKVHRIDRASSEDLEEAKTSFHQLKEEYVENDITGHIENNIKVLKAERKAKKRQIVQRFKKQRTENEAEITRIKNRKEKDKIELDGTIYHPVRNKFIAEYIITTIMFLGELWANFQSTSFFFRESGIASLILAFSIGLVLYFLGLGTAKNISTKKPLWKTNLKPIAFTVLAVIIFFVLAKLRVSLSESKPNLPVLPVIYILALNIGFYAGIILAKRYISPSKETLESNREHKRIKTSIADKNKSVKQLENRIEKSYDKEKKQLDIITKEYEKLIEAQKSEYKEKYELLKQHQIRHNQLLKRGLQIHQELTALALECASLYVQQSNLYRSDGLVVENPKVELSNPLKKYELIHDHQINNLFNMNLN